MSAPEQVRPRMRWSPLVLAVALSVPLWGVVVAAWWALSQPLAWWLVS